MEGYRARALGRDSKAPRRKGLSPARPATYYEPGEKRPKLWSRFSSLSLPKAQCPVSSAFRAALSACPPHCLDIL
ncbi:Protein diaphanous-like protein 3 [Microtus ochrogaster]|uniref:Protein diaphanous-like protein 3 n=1 Tax=Microtus ochrogaster TaxID=79684 RepID=A0A8J6KTH4_MICOH|nr:Protein diaphanous-like protein 3 [Microtus ochrogaster]